MYDPRLLKRPPEQGLTLSESYPLTPFGIRVRRHIHVLIYVLIHAPYSKEKERLAIKWRRT